MLSFLLNGRVVSLISSDAIPQYTIEVDNHSRTGMAPGSNLRDWEGHLILKLQEADFSDLLATGWTWPERMVPINVYDASFKKAKELGILMGIGTDFVFTLTGMYPKPFFIEMDHFVELGYTPMETLVCATKNGAIILGKENELGTIEAGKLADLQVIDGDPLESFDVLGKPEFVVIGGRLHHYPQDLIE